MVRLKMLANKRKIFILRLFVDGKKINTIYCVDTIYAYIIFVYCNSCSISEYSSIIYSFGIFK